MSDEPAMWYESHGHEGWVESEALERLVSEDESWFELDEELLPLAYFVVEPPLVEMVESLWAMPQYDESVVEDELLDWLVPVPCANEVDLA